MTTPTLLHTGISLIDENLFLEPGQLIVVRGTPKAGKSDLVMSVVARIHQSGPILIDNLEETPQAVCRRILVAEGSISFNHLRQSSPITAEEQANLEAGLARLSEAPLHVMHTFDLAALEAKILETRPMLVVVDHLHLFFPPSNWQGTPEEYKTHVAKELAHMSRRGKTTIILIAPQGREGAIPNRSMDAGCAEESADQVWLITRREGSRALLKLAKNRRGPFDAEQELEYDERTRTYRDIAGLAA